MYTVTIKHIYKLYTPPYLHLTTSANTKWTYKSTHISTRNPVKFAELMNMTVNMQQQDEYDDQSKMREGAPRDQHVKFGGTENSCVNFYIKWWLLQHIKTCLLPSWECNQCSQSTFQTSLSLSEMDFSPPICYFH